MDDKTKTRENKYADMGARLKQIRSSLGFTGRQFAEAMGMSSSTLSGIETGSVGTTVDFFLKLQARYRVNLNYLFSGIGPMHLRDEEKKEKKRSLRDEREPGDKLETIDDIVWFMERSDIFRHYILASSSECLLNRGKHIKKQIEEGRKKT